MEIFFHINSDAVSKAAISCPSPYNALCGANAQADTAVNG